MIEIWKDVVGYEGLYKVSNLGNVLSLRKRKLLSQYTRKTGYKHVTLTANGKRKNFLVHRLVAIAFLDNPKNLPMINHKDENPSNNRVDNLEWCTGKYNSNYGTGKDRSASGHYVPVACFKNGKLIKIYNSIKDTEKDGFTPHAVCYVCRGNRPRHKGYEWKYVD